MGVYCRHEAFELFARHVRRLDEPGALLRCAVALAMHELHDASVAAVETELDALAGRVRQRVTSGRPQAYLAHLHVVLFDEEGYHGDVESYSDPRNSYLPSVIERRRGLPIALTLLYREVGERVGLRVDGINAPGHFLAAVHVDGDALLVDPFFSGRALTSAEAYRRIEEVTGQQIEPSEVLLRPATPRQWIARMLRNLIAAFESRERRDDAAAMLELAGLLG